MVLLVHQAKEMLVVMAILKVAHIEVEGEEEVLEQLVQTKLVFLLIQQGMVVQVLHLLLVELLLLMVVVVVVVEQLVVLVV